MNNLNFKIKLTPQQVAYRKQLVEKLCKNTYVQRFLKDNNLGVDFVEKNTSYLEDWTDNLNRCKGCQGLTFCRQNVTGLYQDLFIDDYNCIGIKYRPCRYKRRLNKDTEHEKNYRLSHLSTEDYLVSLQKIDLKKEQQENNKTYLAVYSNVQASLDGAKGLYLSGEPGVGKSYLMMCVTNYYAKNGKKVSFVKMPKLISDLKSCFNDDDYQRDVLNDLYYSDVLVLDDLGSESVSKWSRDSILFPILDFRMERKLKTYFTSNLDLEQLEDKYANCDRQIDRVSASRIKERIRSLSNEVKLSGNSRR